MQKVKEMIAAGVSVPTAIKELLGMSVADFARKHELNENTTRGHLAAVVRATPETCMALAKELGGTPEEWRWMLWLAMRPDGKPPGWAKVA